MKPNKCILRMAIFSGVFSPLLQAAPLSTNTPVYSRPDVAATITATLAAGAEPAAVTSPDAIALPAGWQAVENISERNAWVSGKDVDKEFNVKTGAQLHTAPGNETSVIGTMQPGEVSNLIDLQGRWVQMHIVQRTLGYINVGGARSGVANPATMSAPATVPGNNVAAVRATAGTGAPPPPPMPEVTSYRGIPDMPPAIPLSDELAMQQCGEQPPRPAPVYATETRATNAGTVRQQSAQMMPTQIAQQPKTQPQQAFADATPRSFEGVLVQARGTMFSKPPYDYQLNDANGNRFAYLDLTGIPMTTRAEDLVGRTVIIYGTISTSTATKEILVKVETLQLR